MIIVIDIFGEEDEETKGQNAKKAVEKKQKPNLDRQKQKQVINIDGEIVTI